MPIITISRQPGSMEPQIARTIANRLGLEVVQNDTLHQMAIKCDPEYKDACQLYEKEKFPSFFHRLMADKPAYKCLFEALQYELAAKGNVIIVGRGGHIVLKDVLSVVRLRLVADWSIRVERTMSDKKLSKDDAEAFLEHFSHQHKAMIRAIFDEDIENTVAYDIIINTARLSAEQTAEVICRYIEVMHIGPLTDEEKEALRRRALEKRIESLIRKKVPIAPYLKLCIYMPTPGKVRIEGVVEHRRDIQLVEDIVSAMKGISHVEMKLKALYARLSR